MKSWRYRASLTRQSYIANFAPMRNLLPLYTTKAKQRVASWNLIHVVRARWKDIYSDRKFTTGSNSHQPIVMSAKTLFKFLHPIIA